jgi:ferritin-like metal-binding protein YciE
MVKQTNTKATSHTANAKSSSTHASRPAISKSSGSKPATKSPTTSSRAAVKRAPAMASSKATTKSTSSSSAKKANASHSVDNLYQLLLNELNDLLSAENQIIDHLPALSAMSSNVKLKESLQHHLQETKMQANRLKKIFHVLDEVPEKHWCVGMEGVLKEGAELLSMAKKGPTKDACIIAAAQKVEHYEICGYGTARAHAQQLKLDEVAHLLKETLEEEVEADRILSKLAEGSFFSTGINKQALELEEYAVSHR